MESNIKKIPTCQMKTSEWTGGTTTEIYIYPESSNYGERNFLFRVSRATIDIEESDFTKLEGYDRILTVIEGEIALQHGSNQEPTKIHPLQPYSFGGEEETKSYGMCSDFNLMFQKGKKGEVEIYYVEQEEISIHLQEGNLYVIYIVQGKCEFYSKTESFDLQVQEAIVIEEKLGSTFILKNNSKQEKVKIIVCSINKEL